MFPFVVTNLTANFVVFLRLPSKVHAEVINERQYCTASMEFCSKWNITQTGMSLKMECHSKCNVTQNKMSLKMECHSK